MTYNLHMRNDESGTEREICSLEAEDDRKAWAMARLRYPAHEKDGEGPVLRSSDGQVVLPPPDVTPGVRSF
jgi:hypothetical protein